MKHGHTVARKYNTFHLTTDYNLFTSNICTISIARHYTYTNSNLGQTPAARNADGRQLLFFTLLGYVRELQASGKRCLIQFRRSQDIPLTPPR